MDTERICPSCQKPLTAGVPLGLCPECLIKSGFPSGAESADAKQSPFVPPTVGELAKLFPQLEILELIGKGGMGAVYKARQPKLNRFVALKILPPSIGSEPAFAVRFAREAQALAQLNHPGIVTLYEFGEAGGLHFFMMEFVDGVNLRQLLINGRIAPREALAIVPQICDALQFAHDQGIVHRDIKPENILLDRRGRVKVADFGLAKIIGGENEPIHGASVTGATTLTETGKIIGTPQYMSPEQIAHPADVDHRADIYALGVVFYQMLTGELPGKKIEAPSSKVQIDVRLDEVVLRALEKKPELRYQQVSALKTEVETIAGASPRSQDNWPGRFTWAHIPLFIASMSGVLGIVAFCLFPNPPQPLVWSILGAALLGIILGIPARRSWRGKPAIIVGGINATIWLTIFIVTSFRPDTSFYIGQTSFPKGDSIVITSVRRTKEQIAVKGHYNLVSADSARLDLYITTSSTNLVPTDTKQLMRISRGQGDFELIHPHPVPGMPHVTMYSSDGKGFAGIYFGNKEEALEESKLDLGYYQSSNGIVAAAQTLQSNMGDISSPTSPFRDTAKYLSPFTMVHFDTNDVNKVVVAYNGSEYELVAIDDLTVADILDSCRRQYGQSSFGEGWAQKRFAEDLVVVLSDMKHPVSSDNTVSLTLVDPQTGQQKIIAHAPMTEKNRAAIFQDRTLDNSNLLQSLPQK